MSGHDDTEGLAEVQAILVRDSVLHGAYAFKDHAAAILASPWLADRDAAIRDQAAAKAWDEGYEAALNDAEARYAPPGPNGPVDPTFNPYIDCARAVLRAALPEALDG